MPATDGFAAGGVLPPAAWPTYQATLPVYQDFIYQVNGALGPAGRGWYFLERNPFGAAVWGVTPPAVTPRCLESAEQRAARWTGERDRRNAAARERRLAREAGEERQRMEAAARERSLALLGHVIGPQRLDSYLRLGWFELAGSRGGRWRITSNGISGNVELMPRRGDEWDAQFCAHLPDGPPPADHHAAQALALITDEDAFIAVAVMLNYRDRFRLQARAIQQRLRPW